jgi:xanthine dehydrogenase accessory factor
MESLDLPVLRGMRDWSPPRAWEWLPRPLGSILAPTENGRFAGSMSGGCIEDDLV